MKEFYFKLTEAETNLILDTLANNLSWAKANQLIIKISQQTKPQIEENKVKEEKSS